MEGNQVSYSQLGEDKIVDSLVGLLRITDFTYLDIGANDPIKGNNTYLFYTKGSTGVLVEPLPLRAKRIQEVRPKDIVLQAALSDNGVTSERTFYVMSADTLSTLSHVEASRIQAYGSFSLTQQISVEALSFRDLIESCRRRPNLVSVDIEGCEFEALKTFPFDTCKPEIFCIETLIYTEDKTNVYNKRAIDLVCEQGYTQVAHTIVNTLFARTDLWEEFVGKVVYR